MKIRTKHLYRLNRDISYAGTWEEYPKLLFAEVHYFRNWGNNKLREEGYGKLVSMGSYYYPNWGKAIKGAEFDYSKIRKKPKPSKIWYNRG